MAPTNSQLAELLALEAEQAAGHLKRAYRRASRRAFTWEEEASAILANGRSLTTLPSIGRFLAHRVKVWIEEDVVPPPPPPLRQGFLTLTEARSIIRKHNPPAVRGDLQMHSDWSDGSSTIGELAESGAQLGYEYIAITDHSQGLAIAGGLDESELRAQSMQIEALKAPLRVLRSVEMNLSVEGSGDLAEDTLRGLDIVLGAFHSKLRLREDQTPRYIAALENPHVHVLAHPRGRIYDFRAGLTADWEQVFAHAARLNKAVEVDAFPDRQDLDSRLLRKAHEAGVWVSIGTDAHRAGQLEFIDLGLAAALAARIQPERILNFLPAEDLLRWASQS